VYTKYRAHDSYGIRLTELQRGAFSQASDCLSSKQCLSFRKNDRSKSSIMRCLFDFGLHSQFVGAYTASEAMAADLPGDSRVEAVVTLAAGELQIQRPGRLPNRLIPVGATQIRIKDFFDAFSVEFAIADGKVVGMMIYQQGTTLHIAATSMRTYVELMPLP
jgi:hypothetical protein